jgi:hypothetical protein
LSHGQELRGEGLGRGAHAHELNADQLRRGSHALDHWLARVDAQLAADEFHEHGGRGHGVMRRRTAARGVGDRVARRWGCVADARR